MAQAVRDSETRRRTLTVYTDVRRVTDALAIDDTSTITVLLVTSEGYVTWRATGSWTEHNPDALLPALVSATVEGSGGERPEVERFVFAFGARVPRSARTPRDHVDDRARHPHPRSFDRAVRSVDLRDRACERA